MTTPATHENPAMQKTSLYDATGNADDVAWQAGTVTQDPDTGNYYAPGMVTANITQIGGVTMQMGSTSNQPIANSQEVVPIILTTGTNGGPQYSAFAIGADNYNGVGNTAIAPWVWNGASYDRQMNNLNTTTGDSGTKTATFAGATQTNYNARGALITVLLGTVSGNTPTLACQLQWSPDGGTTWLNVGSALANLTTSNQTGTIWIYPTNISTAGATPAALTTGASQTLMLNAPLARTWRLNYTIGAVSSPSFAISSVQVNYIL